MTAETGQTYGFAVPDRALSFGSAADLYDQVRPGYPVEAVRWALEPAATGGANRPLRVIDLGAGTGILTRILLRLGHQVTPVEPDAGMRARLTEASGGLAALDGAAERIPVPDASVDAVLAAQSYHWFDRDRAHREAGRVVRPGGVFAVMWNVRDQRVPWTAAFSRIIEGGGRDDPAGVDDRLVDPDFGPDFGPVTGHEVRHEVSYTRQSLFGLVHSRSYYLTAGPESRQRVDREVSDLLDNDPALAGRPEFTMPYRTVAYRAVRLAR